MRTITVSAIALSLCLLPGIVFGQSPSANTSAEDAARRVVQRHEDARNRSDWKAMAETFTADADQLTSAGEWRHGRADIEKGVAASFSTAYGGGTYMGRIDTVRVLGDSTALVNGTFEISNIGSGGTRRGNTTFVVVRTGGQWLITAVRWMVPTAAGALQNR